MEEFPSNAKKVREAKENKVEPKNVEKVIEGEATRRKKPLSKRFAESFVGGDAKGVWAYVLFDVLIPAAKDMVADAASQGVERFLFGDSRSGRSRAGSRPSSGYVSYNRYSPTARREEPRISRRARASHDFDEIVLETRPEAERVVERLFDLVDKYEAAAVADLYELVGVDANFTDDKWGWTDLRGSGVSRVRNGYLLDLPSPQPLD